MDFKSWPYWLKGVVIGVLISFLISLPYFPGGISTFVYFLNLLYGISMGIILMWLHSKINEKKNKKDWKDFFRVTKTKFTILITLLILGTLLPIILFACIFAGKGVCSVLTGAYNVLFSPSTWAFELTSSITSLNGDVQVVYDFVIYLIFLYALFIFWSYFITCLITYTYGKIKSLENKKRKKK